MATMRAKMKVGSVIPYRDSEGNTINEMVSFYAVSKPTYAESELDEDNTFARMSPSAHLQICIANPALHGTLQPGQTFYVDFTEVDAKA